MFCWYPQLLKNHKMGTPGLGKYYYSCHGGCCHKILNFVLVDALFNIM